MRMLALLLVLLTAWWLPDAATAQQRVHIPPASALYRHRVEQATARAWGVQANPALLAAQLHQESHWRPGVASHVGAQGIAQFMPSTARWIASVYPDELAGFDPWEPQQAIMAAALYDKWLYDRATRIGPGDYTFCSRWAFALRAYNGGLGWLTRERNLARAAGGNANDWRVVERYRARADWAHRENTGYPRRILLVLEPAYLAAGWSGRRTCPT